MTTRRPHASASHPDPRRGSRWTGLALLTLLLAWGPGCEREADPGDLPPLPGVDALPEGQQWFWRHVLAAPLPGEPAVRHDLLEASPPAAILEGLVELPDDEALTTLMTALTHPVEGVAVAAARDLGLRGHRAALPRLVKGLGPYPVEYDASMLLRAAEASALARLGSPAGMPFILAVLAEGTELEVPRVSLPWPPTTRMAFAQELALEGLVALAGEDFGFHPDASLPARAGAVERARAWWEERRLALWQATPPLDGPGVATRVRLLVAHLRAYQLRQVDGARYTLTHLGPPVLPFLEEGLSSPDDYVRLHVLQVLQALCEHLDGKGRARVAIIASAPLLDDTAPSVAEQAARVCGAARVSDPLVVALERREEAAVRLAVVDALGATGLPTAHDVLAAWEPGPSAPAELQVAHEAALLGTDPDRSAEAFLALLAHADPAVAFPAVERLVQLTGSDHDLDPSLPPDRRAEAIERAGRALAERLSGS